MKRPNISALRCLFVFLVSTLVLAFLPVSGMTQAQDKPLKLRLSYSAANIQYAPIWMAQEEGLYRKQGLNVELVLITTASLALGGARCWRGPPY